MTYDSISELKGQARYLAEKYLNGEDLECANNIINNDFEPLGVGKHFLYLLTSKRICDMATVDKGKLKEIAHSLGL